MGCKNRVPEAHAVENAMNMQIKIKHRKPFIASYAKSVIVCHGRCHFQPDRVPGQGDKGLSH
jgi:hypothetical protein